MADQIVDSLIVEIRMRTEALERGLATAEGRIDDFTRKSTNSARQQASAAKASAQEQSAAYAMVAVAAAAAFVAIVSAVKSGIEAANQYTSALTGLRSVAEGTGQDFGVVQGALNELTADGLIPVSDAATALKNLLMRGFEGQQAVDMLTRLKDSAAFGRQASLSMGEAVRSATEGLKNENSILVDNAGVTKNVSVMWKEYAQQIGKGADSLTTAEKRQAEYNGIMQETRFQIGDAVKYAATFAGTQAELGAATLRTEQAFGSAVQGGIQPFMQALTPMISGVGEYIQQNPSFVAAITAGGATMMGFIAILGIGKKAVDLFTGALGGMKVALGWAGIAAGVIALLVGIASAANEAAKASAKAAAEIQDSIKSARQEQTTLKGYQELVAGGSATHEELSAVRDKIIQQSPELIAGYTAEGDAILKDSAAIQEKIKQLQDYVDMQEEALNAAAGSTLADADEQKKKAIEDQQKALANYNKELENLANLSAQRSAMKDAGIGAMEFGGQLVYLDEVETRLLGVRGRMEQYKSAWADALGSQQEAEAAAAATNAILMQEHIDSLGQLSEVQQYTAEQTLALAMEENMSLEEFNKRLQTRLYSESYMLAMEQQMAQAAVENSDAVKQWADQEKGLENIRKANTAVDEAKKIKDYTTVIKQGQKGTKEYSEAKKALAKHFGTEEEAIETSIDAYAALADKGLDGATAAQEKLRASLQQAIADLQGAGAAAAATAADLEKVLAIFDQLRADTSTSSSGGGGSPRKKAWEEELEMIERVMDEEDEYAQQYLEHIDGLLQNETLSSKERQRLEKERVYAQQAVNGELEQAHIDYLERLLRRERLNADQRLDIEQRLFEAKSALMAQYTELASTIVNAYTARLEEQRDMQLSAIQDQISAVQERANKEIEAIRKAADARVDAINDQIRAIDDLMKAQDRADKDEEDADKLRRLQAQLAYEKDGRNRQKLLEQLAALDASITKRHAQEQLEDQKQALKDQQDTIRDEAEKQIEVLQQQAEREQETLNRRLKSAQSYWDNRLRLENVQREALNYMINASEAEIIALLKAYAPEYFDASAALGQAAYSAIKPKMDAIIDEAKNMADSVVAEANRAQKALNKLKTINAQSGGGGTSGTRTISLTTGIQSFASSPGTTMARMFNTMQQAVDGVVYRSIRPAAVVAQSAISTSGGRSATQTRSVKVEQTVIMQQPVPSPYQNARALRRESERLAKLI